MKESEFSSRLARPRGVRLQHEVEPPIPFLQWFITPTAHAVNIGLRSVRRAAAILGLSPVSVSELCAMYGSPLFGDVRTQPGRARMGRSTREDASSGETRPQTRSLGRRLPPQAPCLVTSSTSSAMLIPQAQVGRCLIYVLPYVEARERGECTCDVGCTRRLQLSGSDRTLGRNLPPAAPKTRAQQSSSTLILRRSTSRGASGISRCHPLSTPPWMI